MNQNTNPIFSKIHKIFALPELADQKNANDPQIHHEYQSNLSRCPSLCSKIAFFSKYDNQQKTSTHQSSTQLSPIHKLDLTDVRKIDQNQFKAKLNKVKTDDSALFFKGSHFLFNQALDQELSRKNLANSSFSFENSTVHEDLTNFQKFIESKSINKENLYIEQNKQQSKLNYCFHQEPKCYKDLSLNPKVNTNSEIYFKEKKKKKYQSQNHKLKSLSKPHLNSPHSIFHTLPSQKQNVSLNSNLSSCQFPSFQQLQEKIQYYQKMQEFYLFQIQSYKDDKRMLEWKIQLIVSELLNLIMKQKIAKTTKNNDDSNQAELTIKSQDSQISKTGNFNLSQYFQQLMEKSRRFQKGMGQQFANKFICSSLRQHKSPIIQRQISVPSHFQLGQSIYYNYYESQPNFLSQFRLQNQKIFKSEDQTDQKKFIPCKSNQKINFNLKNPQSQTNAQLNHSSDQNNTSLSDWILASDRHQNG